MSYTYGCMLRSLFDPEKAPKRLFIFSFFLLHGVLFQQIPRGRFKLVW
jgi:hypothetical protein